MIEPISVYGLDDREPDIPSAEIPDDRGDQERERLANSAKLPTLKDRSQRQKQDDPEWDTAARQENPRKLNDPNHTTTICGGSECV
jgi:hypothetical protein